MSYGTWQLSGDAAGQAIKITDISDRSITVTVQGSAGENQDTGQQFPKCQ